MIAYSTMSQIGYMFLGVGIGAYADGMFHLLTHAFFKALLFLAAGVIIHALTDEQDIRRMGGLAALMPYTYGVFLIGALSLVGIPPFAGFFSKDPIIASALARGGVLGYTLFALRNRGHAPRRACTRSGSSSASSTVSPTRSSRRRTTRTTARGRA